MPSCLEAAVAFKAVHSGGNGILDRSLRIAKGG